MFRRNRFGGVAAVVAAGMAMIGCFYRDPAGDAGSGGGGGNAASDPTSAPTLVDLKAKSAAILDTVKTEKRNFTAAETALLDTYKRDIDRMEAEADRARVAKQTEEFRSASLAAATSAALAAVEKASASIQVADRGAANRGMTANEWIKTLARARFGNLDARERMRSVEHAQASPEYARNVERIFAARGDADEMRNIAKSTSNVGDEDFVADVVRQFNDSTPILKAHQNVQRRSSGNTYRYFRVIPGGAGYAKTEGVAGSSDTVTAISPVDQPFTTYSGQTVLVTQEAMDDYAADVAKEVINVGMSKATIAFGAAIVTALESNFLVSSTFTPTAKIGGSLAFQDILNAWSRIPVRNRYGVKFMGNSSVIAELIGLLTNVNVPQAQAIGFTPDSLLEIDSGDGSFGSVNALFVGNPTLSLAIGMKVPVRVWTQEVSAGVNMEVQPRFAVGLRDGTALSCVAS